MFLYEECEKYFKMSYVINVHRIDADKFLELSGGIVLEDYVDQSIELHETLTEKLKQYDIQKLQWLAIRVTYNFIECFIAGIGFDPNNVYGYTDFINTIKSEYDGNKPEIIKQEQKDLYNNLVLICLPEFYKLHISNEHIRDFITSFRIEFMKLDSTKQSRVLSILPHYIADTYHGKFAEPNYGKCMCNSIVKYITELNLDD